MILFNFRICVHEFPIEVKCPWRPQVSANIYIWACITHTWVCVYTFACMNIHPYSHTYFQGWYRIEKITTLKKLVWTFVCAHKYTCMYMNVHTHTHTEWVECSPNAQETRVQSQVKSYQRLKKMVLYVEVTALTCRINNKTNKTYWFSGPT